MSKKAISKYLLTSKNGEYVFLNRETKKNISPTDIQDQLLADLKIKFTWIASASMFLMAIYLFFSSILQAQNSNFLNEPLKAFIIAGFWSVLFASSYAYKMRNLVNPHTVDFDTTDEEIKKYQLLTSGIHGLLNGSSTHTVTGREDTVGGYKYNAGASYTIQTKSVKSPKMVMSNGFSAFLFPQTDLLAVANKDKTIDEKTGVSVFAFFIWLFAFIGWGVIVYSSTLIGIIAAFVSWLAILYTYKMCYKERLPSLEDGRIITPMGTLYQDENGKLKGLDVRYEETLEIDINMDSLIVEKKPDDAAVLGYKWKYSNLDGSHDDRFNNRDQHYRIAMWNVSGWIHGNPVNFDSSSANSARKVLMAKNDIATWESYRSLFKNKMVFK